MASAIRSFLNRITKRPDNERADSLDSSEGSRSLSLSRHSSIQGPYREGMQDTSFPLYRTVDIPVRSGDIFARSLFSLGNGVGLRNIIGNKARPKEHFIKGSLIGDVGSIDDSGCFTFCFNIFLPRTHPVNQRKLPQTFIPFEPAISEGETMFVPNYFEAGTVFATEGIQVSRIPNSTSKVDFKTLAREGAVLVLPTGASREDLENPSRIYPYLKEHAASWYQFYNGNSETIAPDLPTANGTLWVVTGIDRVTTWSTATFPVQKEDAGKRRHFTFDGENPTSPWEDHSGRNMPDFETKYLTDGTQGAIFLRVIAIALSPLEWSRHVAYIPPESIECYASLPVPIVGRRARTHYSVPRLTHFSKRNSSRIPEVPFHPSIPLLHILILTDPTAQVAIVADSVWISQLSKRHLTHPEIVQLIRRVINNFDIVNTDGVVTFIPIEDKTGEQVAANANLRRKHQVWFLHQILSWLRKEQDESTRGRALQNMSKVLSLS